MLGSLEKSIESNRYDYCVIGSGPAGLTVALKLADNGHSVVVLEGGQDHYTPESQDMYKGEIVGDYYHPLEVGRLRFMGGTSNHWTGWCRPLDPEDYHTKGTHQSVNWPIKIDDLNPYLKEASDILKADKVPEDEYIPGTGLRKMKVTVSTPVVRFGQEYRGVISAHRNVHLLLDANLFEFETNGSDTISVHVKTSNGESYRVKANRYVLATGGIENSRLLLWSNIRANGALVKKDSTLGRYWTEHPHFSIGQAIVPTGSEIPQEIEFVSPTPEFMEQHNILHCRLGIERTPYKDFTRKLVADIACVAPELGQSLFEKMGKRLICGANIRAAWEQEPLSNNGILLGNELDAMGIPRAQLHWKKSTLDLRTVRTTAEEFGSWLAKSDLGRLKLRPWILGEEDYPSGDEIGGFHHMGGTRMAASADQGVVDSNCKVFGQSNLYIAGSSVFPSGGHTNPTLTIVQLALRLARHLSSLPN